MKNTILVNNVSISEKKSRPPAAPAESFALTQVVHCKQDQYDVYIGRPSIFGNLFRMPNEACRNSVVSRYKLYFDRRIKRDPVFKKEVESLRGKKLGCFCAPRKCHGDVIAQYLNQ